MISKLSKIFIWWNGQTIGTFLFTKIYGNFVGYDEFGNRYYTTKDGKKRWVNYNGKCEASSIAPNWHSWIHKTTNSLPKSSKFNKIQKNDFINNNTTGTRSAYHPQKSKNLHKYDDYTAWEPKN